jgi:hypothetical protein
VRCPMSPYQAALTGMVLRQLAGPAEGSEAAPDLPGGGLRAEGTRAQRRGPAPDEVQQLLQPGRSRGQRLMPVANTLMELRKIANHPLIRCRKF